MYIYVYVYIYVYICIYMCIYICIYICTYIYVHIYICIYINIIIYIYIYPSTPANCRGSASEEKCRSGASGHAGRLQKSFPMASESDEVLNAPRRPLQPSGTPFALFGLQLPAQRSALAISRAPSEKFSIGFRQRR